MNWQLKAFAELTTTELYDIIQRREQVFVVEQTCPYLDADGTDVNALHLWANSDTETVVAYARIFLGEGGD
ncbi:MAG: GNAT family N-acetyltransferase, partial [Idiomarina sp.]